MKKRVTILAAAAILAGSIAAGASYQHRAIAANLPAAASASATSGFGATTPQANGSATPRASGTGTPGATATTGGKVSPTPFISHGKITLPKPIALVVGGALQQQGLSQAQAFAMANNPKNKITFLVVAPSYTIKNFELLYLTVNPAQDIQTPASASLQYVPMGLTTSPSKLPSYTLFKQGGNATPLINPGGKIQTVTIHAGKNGIGVVKGQLVDLKYKSGTETVLIAWRIASVNYQVTSNITVSKVPVSELLKVAAGFQ